MIAGASGITQVVVVVVGAAVVVVVVGGVGSVHGALLGSFIVGAAAGIVPAINAAKQNPVEALRG